jgi:uncharacterized membrane protein HdeD (DUF308 family)
MEHALSDQDRGADGTGRKWTEWPGWDYLPGIAFMVIGAFALTQPVVVTSLATSIALGAMLCVCGIFALVGGLVGIGHRGGWLVALLGALSIAVGVFLLYNPVAGAVSLVWALGAWLVVGAAFELALAFSIPAGRGWLVLVGLVDLAFGAIVLMLEPLQAVTFLGFFIGVSLIIRGLWSVVFAADVHRLELAVRPV